MRSADPAGRGIDQSSRAACPPTIAATTMPPAAAGIATNGVTTTPRITSSAGDAMTRPPTMPAIAARARLAETSPMSATVPAANPPMAGWTRRPTPIATASITGRERAPHREASMMITSASDAGTNARTVARVSGRRRNANVSGSVSSTQ